MSLLNNLLVICHALAGPILVIKHILSYLVLLYVCYVGWSVSRSLVAGG